MALSQAYLEWALPTTSFILILTAMLGVGRVVEGFRYLNPTYNLTSYCHDKIN